MTAGALVTPWRWKGVGLYPRAKRLCLMRRRDERLMSLSKVLPFSETEDVSAEAGSQCLRIRSCRWDGLCLDGGLLWEI